MTARIGAMTRTQLMAALRAVQVERDRAVARANHWHARYAEACRHLASHFCDDRCAPCEHETCGCGDCGCDCHVTPYLEDEEPGL